MTDRSAFTRLRDRVTDLEDAPDPATARAVASLTREIRGTINKTARQIVTCRLGAVTAKTPAVTMYVHSWGASYPAGGESISTLESLVPGFVAAVPSSGGGYAIEWNASTNKLVAYTAPGTEVVATTNLQLAIGSTPVLVYGVAPTILDAYEARGDEVLQGVHVVFSEDVAADGTNCWTVEARLKTASEEYGRRVGTTLSNASRSFVGSQRESLYSVTGGSGRRMTDADRLVLYVSPATQSCKALGDVTLVLDVQRKVI